MTGKYIDLTGKRFGRLIVLKRVENKKSSSDQKSQWLCKCDCGKTTVKLGTRLRNGYVKSCGCLEWKLYRKQMVRIKELERGYIMNGVQ